MSYFVVVTSSAKVPASRRRFPTQYRNVAVIEAENGIVPKMISPRAKGVIEIVAMWPACAVGKTDRCAYDKALLQANQLAAKLNGVSVVAQAARGEVDAEEDRRFGQQAES